MLVQFKATGWKPLKQSGIKLSENIVTAEVKSWFAVHT
jgi:hypothetical protein